MSVIPRLDSSERSDQTYLDFLRELEKSGFSGDLSRDFGTRLVTSTAKNIYQVLPQCVVYPKTTGDLKMLLETALSGCFQGVKLTPRGGGTGTNGQSLSDGVIVDCSRHMNRVLELNLEEGWVRVQSGVMLDQLNDFLRPHGIFFAPSITPSSRATIGGMINTDACGKGSRVYGRTSDHVLELQCVLSDVNLLNSIPLD